MRRRIAWLLGKWVDVGISADTRVAIYQGLLDLLSNESDMVVRLTAAHSLKAAIDDWDFEISILLPFLGMAMDQVLKLLSEVEETDTIMKLVADLNAVIDRTGEHVSYRRWWIILLATMTVLMFYCVIDGTACPENH